MKLLIIISICMAFALPALGAETASKTDPNVKTLVWPDGTRYEGGVVNGKRNGQGTIFWTDGTQFVGTFKDDMRDGTGSMILPDGTVYNGFFSNDKLVSQAAKTPVPTKPAPETPAPQVSLVEATPPPQSVMLEERVVAMNDMVKGDLTAMIDQWASAWSERNVIAYLDFYSKDFVVPGNQSRSGWESLRRSRLTRPSFINVGISYSDFTVVEPNIVEVSFNQSYKSDNYSDNTLKTLRLRKEGSTWKILEERSK